MDTASWGQSCECHMIGVADYTCAQDLLQSETECFRTLMNLLEIKDSEKKLLFNHNIFFPKHKLVRNTELLTFAARQRWICNLTTHICGSLSEC